MLLEDLLTQEPSAMESSMERQNEWNCKIVEMVQELVRQHEAPHQTRSSEPKKGGRSKRLAT